MEKTLSVNDDANDLFLNRHFGRGGLQRKLNHNFVRFVVLQREYMNQTFNFMPELKTEYESNVFNQELDEYQNAIASDTISKFPRQLQRANDPCF